MALRKQKPTSKVQVRKENSKHTKPASSGKNFHIEFKNEAQSLAWAAFQQHDVLFLIGPAGTGKSFLASAFATEQILNRHRTRIILTRPIVESGESLGFLPGEFEEKVHPYMMPLYDCIDKLVGREGPWRDRVDQSVEVAPIAYMRGRALCNKELIPTPNGMIEMGDIKVGDFVIGSNGEPVKVLKVYPQGKKSIYAITFSDGTKSLCSEDHLWPTMTLDEKKCKSGFSIKTTREIRNSLKNEKNKNNHLIPLVSSPVEFMDQKTPIDPYLLGKFLASPNFEEFVLTHQNRHKLKTLENTLPFLGLLKNKTNNCFVPDCYKFNNSEIRWAIFQGLMDVGGYVKKTKSNLTKTVFETASQKLAEDVMFLVRSFGGIATCKDFKNKKREKIDNYVVQISMSMNPFRHCDKSAIFKYRKNLTKSIISVDLIKEDLCTCIKVDAPDHLFLTNDFIVTHNTFDDAVCIFDEAQNASMLQLKLFLTRFGENSKIIITGDPTQSDIGGKVALVEVMQKLRGVEGVGVVEFKPNAIVRHQLVGKIIEKLEV